MKKYISIIAIVMFAFSGYAQDLKAFYADADKFFSTHVSNGRVDYKTIVKDPSQLDALLTAASQVKVAKSDAANYQAFWINAYNLAVVKGIVTNYPTKSPLDIKGFFDKTKYKLGGKSIVLNDIEHKLLRANFDDARFHFVLVCAGLGCPPLINKAYLPATLDAQLEEQTKIAINNPKFLKVNDKKKRVQFSQIMEWYKGDFTKKGQSLIDFANKYRDTPIPAKYKSSYYKYDWRLNEKK